MYIVIFKELLIQLQLKKTVGKNEDFTKNAASSLARVCVSSLAPVLSHLKNGFARI